MPLEFVVGDEKTLREALLSEGPRIIRSESGVEEIVCDDPLWVVERPHFDLRLPGVVLRHPGLEFKSCLPFRASGMVFDLLPGSTGQDALSIAGPDRDDASADLFDFTALHGMDGTLDLAASGSVTLRRFTVAETRGGTLMLLNPRAGERVTLECFVLGCAKGRIPRFDAHDEANEGLTIFNAANGVLYNGIGFAHTGLEPLALNMVNVYAVPGADTRPGAALLTVNAPENKLLWLDGLEIIGEDWPPYWEGIQDRILDGPIGGYVSPPKLSVFEILNVAGSKYADGTRHPEAIRHCKAALHGARIIDDPGEVGERGR